MSDAHLKEIAKLKAQNTKLRSDNTVLASASLDSDDFLAEIKRATRFESQLKLSRPSKNKLTDTKHNEIACIALSDLHLSEEVSSVATMGMGGYSPIVTARRMNHHLQSAKNIIEIHRRAYNIERIWVPILGDIVGGSIHGLNLTNSITDAACVVLAARMITMFLLDLASLGIPIDVDTSVGNHGRIAMSNMPSKRQAHNNYDWLVYEMVSDAVKNHPLINMKVSVCQMGIKKLYDHTYVFEHGIDISPKKEDQLEVRLRNMMDNEIFRKANGNQGESFSMAVIGNTHVAKLLPKMIVSGAYVGNNELAILWRLQPVLPQQVMWGVSKSHCRTWSYMLDLSQAESDNNLISEYTKEFMSEYSK